MATILIIDDSDAIRRTLKDILEYEDYNTIEAENGLEALAHIKQDNVDVALCDIKMPGMDGIEVLEKIKSIKPDIPVIMISGHGTIDNAVDAIKKGAFDFLEKPLDLNRTLITIKNALDKSELIVKTKVLEERISKNYEMVGSSDSLKIVRDMIDKTAPTDAKVLITGENGTGKELVAKQIHEKSKRNNKPYIEVNCAAIPGELIESELFGHEKGAFTSAVKQKKGKFEQAKGGTLFLDEIGDMSLKAQAKVLRALEDNIITRVGGSDKIDVDVRVIAATNKNLTEEIKHNRFREDLYHRLSVIIINVPPLRERREDIPELIKFFISSICDDMRIPHKEISERAVEMLKNREWSGNIRELKNVTERLIILGNKCISEDDVKMYL